jgi:predicted Zn finger-like uncharacterized protein
MRIECPSCQTEYDVPDHKITGRKVRCTHCGAEWVPFGNAVPEPIAAPPPPPLPPPPAPFLTVTGPALAARPSIEAVPQIEPRPTALIAAWVATIVLVLAVIMVAIIRRGAIMNAWPASERLYSAFGLH